MAAYDQQWIRTFGDSSFDNGRAITAANDGTGDIFVVGKTRNNG